LKTRKLLRFLAPRPWADAVVGVGVGAVDTLDLDTLQSKGRHGIGVAVGCCPVVRGLALAVVVTFYRPPQKVLTGLRKIPASCRLYRLRGKARHASDLWQERYPALAHSKTETDNQRQVEVTHPNGRKDPKGWKLELFWSRSTPPVTSQAARARARVRTSPAASTTPKRLPGLRSRTYRTRTLCTLTQSISRRDANLIQWLPPSREKRKLTAKTRNRVDPNDGCQDFRTSPSLSPGPCSSVGRTI
ncbi:hypothetical protein RB213_004289, partial [Colletotrichum asianum]